MILEAGVKSLNSLSILQWFPISQQSKAEAFNNGFSWGCYYRKVLYQTACLSFDYSASKCAILFMHLGRNKRGLSYLRPCSPWERSESNHGLLALICTQLIRYRHWCIGGVVQQVGGSACSSCLLFHHSALWKNLTVPSRGRVLCSPEECCCFSLLYTHLLTNSDPPGLFLP